MIKSWWSVEGSMSQDNSSFQSEEAPESVDASTLTHSTDKAELNFQQRFDTGSQPTLLHALHASYSSNSLSDFFDCSDEPYSVAHEDESCEETVSLDLSEPSKHENALKCYQMVLLGAASGKSAMHKVSLQKHSAAAALSDPLSSTVSRWTNILYSATSVAIQTALLPVTVPLHVAYSTTDYVMGTTLSILDHVLGRNKNLRTPPALESSSDDDEDSVSESTGEEERDLSRESCLDRVDDAKKRDGIADATSRVVLSASSQAIRPALLPVTAPASIASAAASAVAGDCASVVETTGSILAQSSGTKSSLNHEASHTADSVGYVQTHGQTLQSSASFLGSLFSLPYAVREITNKFAGDLGSIVFDTIAPSLAENRNHRSSDDFLDRLRLDYLPGQDDNISSIHLEPVIPVTPVPSFYGATFETIPTPQVTASPRPHPSLMSSTSDYLLRVDDLSIYRQDVEHKNVGTVRRVYYVDMASGSEIELLQDSLSRLVSQGLGLISHVPEVRVRAHSHRHAKNQISWEPERETSTILKRLASMDSESWNQELQTSVLVWSGHLIKGGASENSKFPFFLSSGVVPWRPFDFLEMMWDNSRVKVYNKLCTGRSSLLVLHDEVSAGGSKGTKVVRFTTRVPYTSFSVTMKCVMHVRPLDGPDEGGYIIVSRSVSSGGSGTHFSSREKVDTNRSQNDILWGVNIIRPVPNKPHLSDLTSISQVRSNLVPKFLARRIGLWGIEDFYKNVRSCEPPNYL